MTYKEIQKALKAFKEQGLTTIALNAKKDILETEYDRVMNAMIKDALNTEPEIIEDTEAIKEAVITPSISTEDKVNSIDYSEPSQLVLEISEVSIAEFTVSNSESMVTINEAVTNPLETLEPKDNEVTSKEFIEALSKLVIIFVSSIVKLWCQFNRISQLTKVLARSPKVRLRRTRSGAARSIKEVRADIKTFMQWYFSGFKFPQFI